MPIYKTKDKRDGLTKYRVRINYTDSKGKYHSLTRIAYGLEAAKKLEASMQEVEHTPACNITVPELIDLYLNEKKYELRESTLDKNRRTLNRYVRPLNIRISKLNVQNLSEWKKGINELDLKPRSKKKYICHI